MRYILLVLILHSALAGHSQSFTIYNYSVDQGLPSTEVYEIFQDSKGFLWFATDNGVVKFDGSRMETFHSKDGLTDPVVFSFFEDDKKRLWFRTFSGVLCYMENNVIKKYKYNDKLTSFNNKAIFDYVVNEKDELWFTCRDQIGVIDSLGNLTTSVQEEEGVYFKSVGNHFIMGAGNHSRHSSGKYLPIASVIIDKKVFPVTLGNHAYMNRVIRAITWKGKMYMSLNYEVFVYDGKEVKKILSSDYPVINLSVDQQDNLWVGYLNGGAERFSAESMTPSWKPEFLKNRSVTSITEDHEGGLWFSTLEKGVFHVPNLMIEHFDLPNTARIRGVVNLDDKVIVGDQAGNFIKIETKGKSVSQFKKLHDPLVSLFRNGDNVFLSTNSSLTVFDTQFNIKNLVYAVANDYASDKKGNTWAFGGYRLIAFNPEGQVLSYDTIGLPYRAIHLEDSLLFLAERTGLHIRNKKLDLIRVVESLSDIKIADIKLLNDSTLLINTIGRGFLLMNPKTLTFRIFNSKHNFIADHIYSSLIQDNQLWLGTEKGLIKIHTDELQKTNFNFEYLTRKSGLISDKIDFLLNVNDEIWAFSENHFTVVPKAFSKFANEKPLFYIHSVKINDAVIKRDKLLQLNHDENNIQVDFGLISFNNQNILTRYRLADTEDWINTTDKDLLFLSLAPGQYKLEVEYSTDNVHWETALDELQFSIAAPWWKRWYVLTLIFIGLLVLGYLYLRYQQSIYRQRNHYLSIINEHQQRLLQSEIVTLERERNRISKELHDQVGTNLSAIKLTVNQILKSHHEPMTEEIEDQFQVAIQEIKNIIYGLTPPGLERYGLMTGMKNYVGKVIKSIPLNISLKTFGEDSLNYEVNIMVFRVIQELLSNSIKHSFARNVTIHINAFEDMLNIVYEDDGIGFSYEPEKSGLGLDNIESRIHSVNGTLKFESGTFGVSYTIYININLNKQIA
jgi:signal transduction histidine kinase/ligand-binding sensor domain-containing protein